MSSLPETHGRWPLIAAAALAPVTAASFQKPELRPLAILLAHQTEEWVWPGGFLPWINRDVFGGEDEFPLDRRDALVINVGLGWALSLTVLAGTRAAAPQAMLYTSHIGNAGLHIGWAVLNRKRDPGLVTGALGLLPLGVTGLIRLAKDPEVSRRKLGTGIAAGIVVAAGMVPFFKARLKRS